MSVRVLAEGRSGGNTGKLGGVAAIMAALVLAVAGCGGSEPGVSDSGRVSHGEPRRDRLVPLTEAD